MAKRENKWTASVRKAGVVFTDDELEILDKHGSRLAAHGRSPSTSPEIAKIWRKYLNFEDHIARVAELESQLELLREGKAEQQRTIAKLYAEIESLRISLVAEKNMVASMRAGLLAKNLEGPGPQSNAVASTVCSRCNGSGGVTGHCFKCGGTGWVDK
jgi:hypothetical protein